MSSAPSASTPPGPPAVAWTRDRLGAVVGRQIRRLVPLGFFRRLVPRPVIGLCYHVVSDRALPHVTRLYPYKSPRQFEADLVYLKQNFRVLRHDELSTIDSGGRPGVVITFDDGFAECYTEVRPLLRKHGLSAIFFVTPSVIDNRRMFSFDRAALCIGALLDRDAGGRRDALERLAAIFGRPFAGVEDFAEWLTRWIRTMKEPDERFLTDACGVLEVDAEAYLRRERPYLTTEQVREMDAEGYTIGAHALRHVALGGLDDPDEIAAQIVGSCEAVREMVGRDGVPFAFPFDGDGVDRELLREIRERHSAVGLVFDSRRLRPDRDFVVNRLIVDGPPRLGRGVSNLPTYLRGAYWQEFLRERHARG